VVFLKGGRDLCNPIVTQRKKKRKDQFIDKGTGREKSRVHSPATSRERKRVNAKWNGERTRERKVERKRSLIGLPKHRDQLNKKETIRNLS